MEYIQNRLEQWDVERQTIKGPDMNLYSSFLFLANSIIAQYYKYKTYSLLFLFLFVSSIFYHSLKWDITFVIDKLAIGSVVFYGGYIFYINFTKMSFFRISLILSTFLFTFFLFYYGYYKKEYCYNKDPEIAIIYHSILHLISSIGHHLIISSVKLI
jgi:hypothetical protein